MIKLVIGVVAAVFVVIVGFLVIDPKLNNQANNAPITEVSSLTDTNKILITIEGEVNAPGTYNFSEENNTFKDVIAQAGGLTSIADARAYFPDSICVKGKSYYIAPMYDTNDVCSTTPLEKVNINKDSNDQLTKIDGISQTIASSIVAYRNDNGEFQTIEDLLEVYGIGNATYKKIRNYVILHE